MVLHPDGGTEVLDLPPGLPLGIGGEAFETRETHLPDGATLILCTDGLVETQFASPSSSRNCGTMPVTVAAVLVRSNATFILIRP